MKRTAQHSPGKDLPSRIFASNPALLIGAAFEIGMLLGRRSGRTAVGRKLRQGAARAADSVVHLAPDRLARLVPDPTPARMSAKARSRRRTARQR